MTTSDDDSTQGRSIFSDEERNVVMRCILEEANLSERREAFVEMLIDLRQHFGDGGEGWQQVDVELHRLIEWLFKGSETYELALEIYDRRFHVRGGFELATLLRMLIAERLSPAPRADQVAPLTVVAEWDSPVLREAAWKRLEVASAAIMGTDTQRIDCMHGCLKADDATLARILSVLEET
jgi:hypothetical protein